MSLTHGAEEVGRCGGDRGLGRGRAVSQGLVEEDPHDGVTDEQEPPAEEAQRDVQLPTHIQDS